MIHSGAEIGFQKEEKELQKTNYEGTANVISFGKEVEKLDRLVHISTAYVSGQNEGVILESEIAVTVLLVVLTKQNGIPDG